jgi:6-phosphogluconolactonase
MAFMQRPLIAALLGLGLATAAQAASEWVYIGTRGSEPKQGIYAASFDNSNGRLTLLGQQAELQNASWLAIHPGLSVLYSVANSAGGLEAESDIHSFAIDQASGKLKPINTAGAGGSDTTHLWLDLPSNTLFAASHNNGHVTALPVQADGSVGKVVSDQKTAGTGLHPKQNRPQPHSVAIDPATHRYLLNSDVGADRINVFRFDPDTRALVPAKTPFVTVPPGSGARHIAFAPNGKFVYLVTELTAEIRAYRWDAGNEDLREIQAFSAYPASYSGAIPGSAAEIAAIAGSRGGAEIAVSRDGRYVYASVRGDQDSLIVYSIDQRDGKLKEIQRVASGDKAPRSFAFDSTGRWMLVAHEVGSTVRVFRVDPATGKLAATDESLSVPNAAVFAFYSGK